MILFLTSSPSGPLGEPNDDRLLDNTNGFVDHLKILWKPNSKGLMIAADPYDFDANDEMTGFFTDAFNHSELSVAGFKLWDARSEEINRETLMQADVIMLAGGHLPTQNQFFKDIELREMLQDYPGIVIGVSAGTMNCADVVYVQPELPGEAINPSFQRFMDGLGLTQINVLPHYQMAKHMVVDDLRLYEDITLKDSIHRPMIALVDGSYIYCDDQDTLLTGEAYLVHQGKIELIAVENQQIQLKD